MTQAIIDVAAAAIVSDGRVLVTRRHADAHQGGLWEFPGGKVEAGETVAQALQRELQEELGISIIACEPLITVTHHYDDRSVRLHVYKVSDYDGEACSMEEQPMAWRAIADLQAQDFPAADAPVINALKLPDVYLITGGFVDMLDFENRLLHALQNRIRLVQLRLKPDWLNTHTDMAHPVLNTAVELCTEYGARLLLNAPEALQLECNVDGVHADSRKLQSLQSRPDCEWFSASCHTVEDLAKAEQLDADFAVLSPVQHTSSHPDAEPLGWRTFADMIEQVAMPVYALGGVDASHITQAKQAGAQGVAGIGAFWRLP